MPESLRHFFVGDERVYQALYRKWRPKTFSDVCGQETVTTALRSELTSGRLSHAYLFTGCRGTGKTTCAKILAKAVNCEHPVNGDPCNECPTCRGIDDGSVLDVTEIDAASNNGVDNIRDLRDEVAYTPVTGKYRVYIIDEVHMLSPGAFNALLKTLEEPPAHVLFILATTEVHKLPATILSRCQRFDFGRIRPQDIAARLSYVAEQEGMELAPDAAMLLARLADGAMRDALSLLDQCASAGSAITADTVAACTGMAAQDSLHRLTDCLIRRDGAAALGEIDAAYRGSKDMERLCTEWIGYMRGLMILHAMPDPGELIVAAPEDIEKMRQQAAQLDTAAVLHVMTVLQSTLEKLRGGASRRVEMEMAALRLCDPRLDDGTAALTRRIEALENALRAGIPAAPVTAAAAAATAAAQPTATAPTASASAPAAGVPSVPVPDEPRPAEADAPPAPADEAPAHGAPPVAADDEQPFARWGEVLEQLRGSCIPLYAVLAQSNAIIKGGNMLLICTDNAMFKELIGRDNNKELLMAAIRQATGQTLRVGLRRSVRVQKDKADPLSRLMAAGRSAGVDVEEKN